MGVLRKIWPWLCAALSGALLTFSFPPLDLGGLAFIALIPLLSAVWLSPTPKRPWLFHLSLGYCTGIVFFTTNFWWLGELANLYDSLFLKALPLLISLYLALYPALWAGLAGWLARNHFIRKGTETAPPRLLSSSRNLALAFILAAAWTGLEWIRGWLFTGFSWNMLGVALHKEITLIQIADITGIGGISFVLIACNITGLLTVLRLKAEVGRVRIRPHFDFTLTVLLVTLSFAYGIRIMMKPDKSTQVSLNVGVIQPNIPQLAKMDMAQAGRIFDQLSILNEQAAASDPGIQLMLWPEATIPGGMYGDVEIEQFVRNEAARGNFALLLGTDDTGPDGLAHNSAAMISGTESKVQMYHKMHLVPFGEFLPFRSILNGPFGNLVPGDFSPGKGPGIFTLDQPPLLLAPLVCFEDTDGELTRIPVRDGAQILVNITNDGWFGKSCEPYQHLANSIFRCIETRRPMVRGTNTGVTASIDIFGRPSEWLKPHVAGFASRTISVPYSPPVTFYTKHGELFSKLCTALTIGFTAVIFFLRRKRK